MNNESDDTFCCFNNEFTWNFSRSMIETNRCKCETETEGCSRWKNVESPTTQWFLRCFVSLKWEQSFATALETLCTIIIIFYRFDDTRRALVLFLLNFVTWTGFVSDVFFFFF